LYDLQKSAFYFGCMIDEFWDATLADIIRFVNANALRKKDESRDHWSIMRYQTAVLMQMMSDGKGKPIQPTDILKFDDEHSEDTKELKTLSKTQSDKLDAAYQRYINRT